MNSNIVLHSSSWWNFFIKFFIFLSVVEITSHGTSGTKNRINMAANDKGAHYLSYHKPYVVLPLFVKTYATMAIIS